MLRCGGRRDAAPHTRAPIGSRGFTIHLAAAATIAVVVAAAARAISPNRTFSAACPRHKSRARNSQPGSPRVKSGETRTKPEAAAVVRRITDGWMRVHVRRRMPGAVRGRPARDQPRDLSRCPGLCRTAGQWPRSLDRRPRPADTDRARAAWLMAPAPVARFRSD